MTVTAGSRPLALLFNDAVRLEGTIDVSGGIGGAGGYTTVGARGVAVAGGSQDEPFPGTLWGQVQTVNSLSLIP